MRISIENITNETIETLEEMLEYAGTLEEKFLIAKELVRQYDKEIQQRSKIK